MRNCAIYDNKALNFFRGFCGFLALAGFLFQNIWLILITSLLFFFGMLSMNFNFIYQFYSLFSKSVLKQKITPIEKDPGELKFVYAFTGLCFMVSFLMLYANFYVDVAWGIGLVVSFLTLLASFANICAAALMYVVFKKIMGK
jgi:hypothetical protein